MLKKKQTGFIHLLKYCKLMSKNNNTVKEIYFIFKS